MPGACSVYRTRCLRASTGPKTRGWFVSILETTWPETDRRLVNRRYSAFSEFGTILSQHGRTYKLSPEESEGFRGTLARDTVNQAIFCPSLPSAKRKSCKDASADAAGFTPFPLQPTP